MSVPVQTLLGFDFGERRIGVAVGNTLTGAARPLATVAEATVDGRFARIGALLLEWQPAMLVVGRPLHPDGAAHEVTAQAERFARQLQGRFGLPVVLVDERYSTVAAQARLREDPASCWGDADDGVRENDGGRDGGAWDTAVCHADAAADARGTRGARSGRHRPARAGAGRRKAGRGTAADGDDAAAAAVILEQYLNGSE